MESRASAKIKIGIRPEIVDTLKIYKIGLQHCIDEGWNRNIKNNIKLHPFIYKHLRSIGLQSQLAIACIKQSCGMLKKARTKPEAMNISMRYNFPRSASYKGNILSISTIKGRIKIPFNIPTCYQEYFTWNVKESLLRIDKRGRCYFIFTFSKDINTKNPRFHRVLGIDVGVNNIAVTSTRQFYGKEIKGKRIQHDRLVSKLQAKGTKSAKRLLKRISGRWTRFMAWTNHNISKDIINKIGSNSVIVMEELTNIRTGKAKHNKWVHKWAFRQLQNFIEYKGIRKGDRIVYINPAYTSKECEICHSLDTVRHTGFFQCNTCNHTINSDLNGANNIAQRYKRNMCSASVTMPYSSHDESETKITFGIEEECRAKSHAL